MKHGGKSASGNHHRTEFSDLDWNFSRTFADAVREGTTIDQIYKNALDGIAHG